MKGPTIYATKGYHKNWAEQKMNRKKDNLKKHLYGQCMFKMSECTSPLIKTDFYFYKKKK